MTPTEPSGQPMGVSPPPRAPERGKVAGWLSFALGGAILFLGLQLFLPFFEPICWAIILALFFHPAHRWLMARLRLSEGLSSLVMCVVIIAFIILPVFALLTSMTAEVIRVYNEVQSTILSGSFSIVPDPKAHPLLHRAAAAGMELFRTHEGEVRATITEISRRMGEFFIRQGTVVFKNVANLIFKGALMLVTLFYLFKDGEKMLTLFKSLLPLPREEVENLARITEDVLSATLYGNLMTASIQAGLGIFILWVLDFSAPILWGISMGLAAFVPMVGTAIIWGPATIYLFATGLYLKGAILLAYSVLIISQVDYFLRPYLISGKTELHNIFLFFSILGGINVFGLIGLVLGPIIIGLCVAVLELYRRHFLGFSEEGP